MPFFASAYLFEPATGLRRVADPPEYMVTHFGAPLPDGRALVGGGTTQRCFIFDPDTEEGAPPCSLRAGAPRGRGAFASRDRCRYKNFRNPRTTAFSLAVEPVLISDLSAAVTFNHAETDFLTRFANRNDPLLGSPWSTGLGADGTLDLGSQPRHSVARR